MIITIDKNFFAQPRCKLLGYKGETMSRRLEISFPQVENALLYKLRFTLPDASCYDVDVTNGEAYVSGSLLTQEGKVLCQWIATGTDENGQYEVVAKSNVFELYVGESIGDDAEPVPTYEQTADMFDRAVETLGRVEQIAPEFDGLVAKVSDVENELADVSKKHNEDVSYLESLAQNSAVPVVPTVYADSISVTDSVEKPLRGLSLYGRTTRVGTPTPEAPTELSGVGELVSVSVTDGADKSQSILVMTPDGLHGVPVTTDGNYTDDSGQMWICDEVDFEKGVHIKRVGVIRFNGTETFSTYTAGAEYGHIYQYAGGGRQRNTAVLSDTYPSANGLRTPNTVYGGSTVNFNTDFETSDDFKAYLAQRYSQGNPMTLVYVLAAPTETPLTTEQIEAFRALHSYYPHTTVTNDGGAGMKVRYTADTKTYIDNQFKVLFALISTM